MNLIEPLIIDTSYQEVRNDNDNKSPKKKANFHIIWAYLMGLAIVLSFMVWDMHQNPSTHGVFQKNGKLFVQEGKMVTVSAND